MSLWLRGAGRAGGFAQRRRRRRRRRQRQRLGRDGSSPCSPPTFQTPQPSIKTTTTTTNARADKPGYFFGFPQCHTAADGDPYLRPIGPGRPLPDPKFNAGLNCQGAAR